MELEKSIILQVLNEENGEPITGKTRFQKILFLIENTLKENKVDISFNFIPFRYGPYSSKLNFLIDEMVNSGLIKEGKGGIGDKEIVSFRITENGKKELTKFPLDEKIKKAIKFVKSYCIKLSLEKLLMMVYKKHPEFATKSELVEYKFDY